MKIDVYQTKLSVKPFTSWRSMADMLNYLEENKKIASICKKLKETGDKSLKDGLPAMMPMGDVGDLQRKKENCEPTGLVMIDMDSPKAPLLSPQGGMNHAGCSQWSAWPDGFPPPWGSRRGPQISFPLPTISRPASLPTNPEYSRKQTPSMKVSSLL